MPRDLDLDPGPWIGLYGIPSRNTHQPPLTYQISFELEKLVVDRQTYGRRGRLQKSRPNNNLLNKQKTSGCKTLTTETCLS